MIDELRHLTEKIKSELTALGEEHRSAMERGRSITESLSRIEKRKEPTQTKLLQISERVRELKARKSLLEAQLGTSLDTTLSDTERATLEATEVGAAFLLGGEVVVRRYYALSV
jgi:predicted nuclease with TOPRIM domain